MPSDLDTFPKGSRPAPHNAFGEFDRLESIRTPRSRVLLAAARPYASAGSMSARSMPIISRAAATARALTAAVAARYQETVTADL
jgi:hypothetical protein